MPATWIDDVLRLKQTLPANVNQGSQINGDRLGCLAQKWNRIRQLRGGKYHVTIERDAFAVCLRPLRACLPCGVPHSPKHSAIKGFKIFCECTEKPHEPTLFHKSNTHRGNCGMIEREAFAFLLQGMRLTGT